MGNPVGGFRSTPRRGRFVIFWRAKTDTIQIVADACQDEFVSRCFGDEARLRASSGNSMRLWKIAMAVSTDCSSLNDLPSSSSRRRFTFLRSVSPEPSPFGLLGGRSWVSPTKSQWRRRGADFFDLRELLP